MATVLVAQLVGQTSVNDAQSGNQRPMEKGMSIQGEALDDTTVQLQTVGMLLPVPLDGSSVHSAQAVGDIAAADGASAPLVEPLLDDLLGYADADLVQGIRQMDGSDVVNRDSLGTVNSAESLLWAHHNDAWADNEGEELLVWEDGEHGMPEAPEMALIRLLGADSGALELGDLLQGCEMCNLNADLEAAKETVNSKASTVLYISTSAHISADGITNANRKVALEAQGFDTAEHSKLLQDLISQGKFNVDL